MRMIPSLVAVAMTVAIAFPGAASAQQLAATGEPVLEVSGAIAKKNSGDKLVFDMAALEKLPQVTIETSTPWNTAVTKFEGVSGKAFIEWIGATGTTIKARAVNDYTIEIPVEDFMKKGVILALKANGQHLSLRDRGPVWVMYPFDHNAELRDKAHQRRSIWQLVSIHVQ
ncbi:MAG: molybdopterin-dependent oxidoreductase [Rhodospirillales bacterium]